MTCTPILGVSLLALQTFTAAQSLPTSADPTNPASPTAASPKAPSAAVPKGLAASEWSSIRAAYEAGRHRIFALEKGWTARNPGQSLNTTFDDRGFITKPDSGSWTWGLDLQSYGWGITNPVTTPRATSTEGGRLSRAWDDQLTEWYVNDSRGLEHGFTVAKRPSSAIAPLTVDLSIRGGLQPIVSKDGRNVMFTDVRSGTALNYNGLTVFDAVGNPVAARWYPIGSDRLRMQIDDATAHYPLTIDPIVQQAYLKASSTEAFDQFGKSVAVSGDTVVVGAAGEDSNATGVNGNQANNSAADAGAAYIFIRSGGVWSQQAYLKASNTDAGDRFASSVAISGDTVVIGAWAEDSTATGVNGDQANNSALSNKLLFDSGAAYVFVRAGGVWSQQAYLKASNTESDDRFGTSVAVSGDTVVVGAILEDSNATGVNGNQANNSAQGSGAAYVFVRSGSVWIQQAYLKASNTALVDNFGESVAVSGETVVVGAPVEDSNATGVNGNQADTSAPGAGAAYVFVRAGGAWSQQAFLKASNTGKGDQFGRSVAVSGDTVVVAALNEDSNATGVNGNQANNSGFDAGAAYVFARSGSVWSQQAYLKASNSAVDDLFGYSVAVSGNTIVVGAAREDSNATGVNGNQADNSVTDSGAAYVFIRSGGVWSQQAYLKASNSGVDEYFGYSVAISGDTVVVGAPYEDSNATGVNGNQADNSATDSGAACVFDLDNNPGTSSYGTGSPGCTGMHTLDVTHAPMIGSPQFGITCNNAPPSSIGLGLLGDGYDLFGSDPFGGGVLIHIDTLVSTRVIPFVFTSDSAGNAIAPAPIPFAASLVGLTYFAQAMWRWTSCSLPPFDLSSSQGLAITVLVP